jgi:glutaredoxin 3
MGAKFIAIEINQMPEGKALKVELQKRTGQSSVPQVFIGGEFIGGCNNGPRPGMGVVPLKASGELERKLRAAGAM